jgi:hypothetical protein
VVTDGLLNRVIRGTTEGGRRMSKTAWRWSGPPCPRGHRGNVARRYRDCGISSRCTTSARAPTSSSATTVLVVARRPRLKASVGSSPQRNRKRVSAEESIECLGRSRHRRRRPSTRSFKDGNPVFVQPISTLSQAGPRDDTWIGLISRFRSSVASRWALVRALILSSVGSSSGPVGGVDTG